MVRLDLTKELLPEVMTGVVDTSVPIILTSMVDYVELLSTIPTETVSVIIVDPPFGLREKMVTSGHHLHRDYSVGTLGNDTNINQVDLEDLMVGAARVLKKGGVLVCFHRWQTISEVYDRMESNNFVFIRPMVWRVTNAFPGNAKKSYIINLQPIISGVKRGARPTFNSGTHRGLWEMGKVHKKEHPAQKPLPLIQDLVNIHSNPGDIVVDCFMGGGTTAIAAMDGQGGARKFIGGDIDPEYLSVARRRISHHLGVQEG